MVRRLVILAALVIGCFAVSPAFAVDFPCADNTTSCDPWAADQDTGGQMGTGAGSDWNGGNYTACIARGSQNQGCWRTGLDENNVERCFRVQESQSCGCHKVSKQLVGACIYEW